tara:strand:+ start:104 stop:478 length:375 start_codon:yes stop_codon:yes gene_type:complete
MNRRDKCLFYFVVLFVIVPGAISFFVKVVSYFIAAGEEGMAGFAHPYINYLCVILGFLFLFNWAFLKGNFNDIEKPAIEMLKMNEEFEKMEIIMKNENKEQALGPFLPYLLKIKKIKEEFRWKK